MIRIPFVLGLGAALLAASSLSGQDAAATAPQPEQKLVRVATLDGVATNQEFQRNVQIMQMRRQALIDLKAQLDAADDPEDKELIQAEFNAALARLERDNQKMIDAYGFSLNRQYTLVVEKAHIYMLVTEAEAAEIEKKLNQDSGGDATKND